MWEGLSSASPGFEGKIGSSPPQRGDCIYFEIAKVCGLLRSQVTLKRKIYTTPLIRSVKCRVSFSRSSIKNILRYLFRCLPINGTLFSGGKNLPAYPLPKTGRRPHIIKVWRGTHVWTCSSGARPSLIGWLGVRRTVDPLKSVAPGKAMRYVSFFGMVND